MKCNEEVSLSDKWCWNNYLYRKIMFCCNTSYTLYTKFNLRWIRDLNTKAKTTNFPEEKTREDVLMTSMSGKSCQTGDKTHSQVTF